ncbi:MAG: hypothetical protein AAFX06_14920 [Planctomycetota bacterium]
MATFEELKIPKSVINKIRSAAKQDESLVTLTTPAGLQAWLEAGNELSKAVVGIGDTTENKIREILKLEAKDVAPPPAAPAEEEPETPEETEANAAPPEPEDAPETPEPALEEEPAPPVIEPSIVSLALDIPLGELPFGYESDQADGGKVTVSNRRRKAQVHLKPEEAKAFLRIREGLLAKNERLPSGDPVVSNADVMRWILSKVIEADPRVNSEMTH